MKHTKSTEHTQSTHKSRSMHPAKPRDVLDLRTVYFHGHKGDVVPSNRLAISSNNRTTECGASLKKIRERRQTPMGDAAVCETDAQRTTTVASPAVPTRETPPTRLCALQTAPRTVTTREKGSTWKRGQAMHVWARRFIRPDAPWVWLFGSRQTRRTVR